MAPKTTQRSFLSRPAKLPTDESIPTIPPPRTPSPPLDDGEALPLRYPETLSAVIEIRQTEVKGLGVFAARDLAPGTVLLTEKPLITLLDTGSRADPLTASIAHLSAPQRASFLSLHSFSLNPNESLHRSIVYSNGYAIGPLEMATGVFETASRINHSCVPNSAYVWKERTGRMVFYCTREVTRGEEVTVDYGHRGMQLKRIYGFECGCEKCLGGKEIGGKVGEEEVLVGIV